MPKDKPGTGGIGGKGHYQGRYGKDLERIEAKLDRILELLDPDSQKTHNEYTKDYRPEDYVTNPTYSEDNYANLNGSYFYKPNEEIW